jgi:hypothetical protein
MTDYELDRPECDPWRPLDCRWRKALRLVRDEDSGRGSCGDETIECAIRYMHAASSFGSDGHTSAPPVLEPELEVVHRAYELHAAAGPQAWIVEARLLARQTPEEIGPQVSLASGVVAMYRSLFFDVADRLEAKTTMGKLAVGLTGVNVDAGCDLHTVLKWFGYNGGPLVLDMAIAVLVPSALAWCPTLAPVDKIVVAKVRRPAGVLMMPIRNAKDQMKLFRLHMREMELTRLEGASANASVGGAFDELARDKVAQMPQSSFEPQPKPDEESPREVCDEEPAVAEDAASWGVA